MLEKGKLRERVKSGEVNAADAAKALLALQRQGQTVSEDAIKWLHNFNPTCRQVQPQPQAEQKQRRKKRRKTQDAVR